MSLKIIWSPASKEEYAIILGYVEETSSIDRLEKTAVHGANGCCRLKTFDYMVEG